MNNFWFWTGWIIISLIVLIYHIWDIITDYKRDGYVTMSGREIFWRIVSVLGGYATLFMIVVLLLAAGCTWLFEHPWWTNDITLFGKKNEKDKKETP